MLFLREVGVEHKVLTLFSKGGQGNESENQCHDERKAKMKAADRYNRMKIKYEQSWNKGKGIRNVFDTEQCPAYGYDEKSDYDTGHFADFFVKFVQSNSFYDEPKTVIRTP